MGDMEMTVDLVVIGSGPGGYAAAFRAADLGLDVAMIDPRPLPGGACLHEGCIPSKLYLYLTEILGESKKASVMGLHFGEPEIDLSAMRAWQSTVVDGLAKGLVNLCERHGVELVAGMAHFEDSRTVRLEGASLSRMRFKNAVIATGSSQVLFPGTESFTKKRILYCSEALELSAIPEKMLIIGGGYEGLELATIYAALGCRITLAEMGVQLLPDADEDVVEPLSRRLSESFEKIYTATRITCLEEVEEGVVATFETTHGEEKHRFDKVLIATRREPVTAGLGLENTSVELDARGFIIVDEQQRSAEKNIFAVGDVTGRMMLAANATYQGRVAAEVIAGQPAAYDLRAIPTVVYTSPQIGWCGLTERQARLENTPVNIEIFPWKYSGRAHITAVTDGLTKVLADPGNGRILGVGICGADVESLIAEAVLAIEMGATVEDLALSLHPHPTFSETLCGAAAMFLNNPLIKTP
ncbi:dihydrolipoyl dehydrogenase [Desulforhopalus sp. IMCC35007]|uniref:dihydrolipoyl dehydrogenase n=1 Tax=Desulforhopalus sp. IMCC35007 TaxID=2569543 RepID=UPI001F0E8EFB|nr:dihydrolipoyl dehydrogenase [Desulforhopalus sp. IMCC35007]